MDNQFEEKIQIETNKNCAYGCGNRANWRLKNGKLCCSKFYNSCPEIKKKNSKGVSKAHQDGKIGTSQLEGKRGWRKGLTANDFEDVFAKNSEYRNKYVKKLIKKWNLIDEECERCGLKDTWNGKSITLELDHINGNSDDNRLENLRFLCPNCHSQTETFKGRNSKGKTKVSDKRLIVALKNSKNIRKALLTVGLNAKGGNYDRCYRLIEEYNVEFKDNQKQNIANKITGNKCIECENDISRGAKRCRTCENERRKNENYCIDCNTEISLGSKRCQSCENKRRKNKDTKINWPKTEWLEKMADEYSYLALSRRLGVSDNAIRKRIRNH